MLKLKFQKLIFAKTGLLDHDTAQGGTGNIPLAVVGDDTGLPSGFVFHNYVAATRAGNHETGSFEFLNYDPSFGGSELGHVLFSHGRGELQPDEGTLASMLFGKLLFLFQQVCQIKFHRFGDIPFGLFEISPVIGNMVEGGNLGAYLAGFFVKGIYDLVFGDHCFAPLSYSLLIILALTG